MKYPNVKLLSVAPITDAHTILVVPYKGDIIRVPSSSTAITEHPSKKASNTYGLDNLIFNGLDTIV